MNEAVTEFLPVEVGHEMQQQQEEEAQIIESQQAMVVADSKALQLGGLNYRDDETYLAAMQHKATTIKNMVVKSGCIEKIQNRDYVKVEGWEMLAQICGARAIVTKVDSLDDGSYLAFAELRANDGRVLQTAQMLCGDESDRMWAGRPKYAKLSMVQTRVKGKVCRMEFAPLMALGGFVTTPAEEASGDTQDKQAPKYDPALTEAIIEHAPNIEAIRRGLDEWQNEQSQDGLDKAVEAWAEISQEDQRILWTAYSKGGPFKNEYRKAIKSDEFAEAMRNSAN